MTDTRRKAQAMLNDARDAHVNPDDYLVGYTALCRAIEQHEAFKQEVSREMEEYSKWCKSVGLQFPFLLERFIIPKPKPDPLVEVIKAMQAEPTTYVTTEVYANRINAALGERGWEIREKGV